MGRITARTRSPDHASRVREADNRRSESGEAAAVGDWDRDFATHPADLAGGRQSIVCFFLFLFTLYTQMYYSCWLDCRVCRCIPCGSKTFFSIFYSSERPTNTSQAASNKYLNKYIELELYNPTSIQVKRIHKTIKQIRKNRLQYGNVPGASFQRSK